MIAHLHFSSFCVNVEKPRFRNGPKQKVTFINVLYQMEYVSIFAGIICVNKN